MTIRITPADRYEREVRLHRVEERGPGAGLAAVMADLQHVGA